MTRKRTLQFSDYRGDTQEARHAAMDEMFQKEAKARAAYNKTSKGKAELVRQKAAEDKARAAKQVSQKETDERRAAYVKRGKQAKQARMNKKKALAANRKKKKSKRTSGSLRTKSEQGRHLLKTALG